MSDLPKRRGKLTLEWCKRERRSGKIGYWVHLRCDCGAEVITQRCYWVEGAGRCPEQCDACRRKANRTIGTALRAPGTPKRKAVLHPILDAPGGMDFYARAKRDLRRAG